ncbi:MAG TPA: hypothetical protein VGD62_13240 [Acidobacteriaceae bacterium]
MAPALVAQGSFSPPLGDPVSGSLYSESNQGGPSSSLAPGDNNLQNPYLRSGINDPLGFLIEGSGLSPYLPANGAAYSLPASDLISPILTDPLAAVHLSEYRSNRALMSGASATSTATARLAFATSSAHAAGSRTGGTLASSFGSGSMLVPFAAGSLAASHNGPPGGAASGFIDPNAVLSATTSKSMTGAAPLTGTGGASSLSSPGYAPFNPDVLAGGVAPPIGAEPSGQLASGSGAADGSDALASPVPSGIIGPTPGALASVSESGTASASGFADSTMGTAGLPSQSPAFTPSPLLSGFYSGLNGSPFASVSGAGSSFLHPSLHAGLSTGRGVAAAPVNVHELARRARSHAMIANPNTPLPSAFEMRHLERAYSQQRSGRGRRPNRYSTLQGSSSGH